LNRGRGELLAARHFRPYKDQVDCFDAAAEVGKVVGQLVEAVRFAQNPFFGLARAAKAHYVKLGRSSAATIHKELRRPQHIND